MAEIQPVSGQPVKNNSGSVLNAGNVTRSNMNNLTLADNGSNHKPARVIASASANIGTQKAVSGGNFAHDATSEQWVAKVIGTTVAGQSNTVLRSGSSHAGSIRTDKPTPYQQKDITSIDYISGTVTLGAADGDTVLVSGIDNRTGAGADDAFATNAGEFAYRGPGLNPVQADFPTRNG